MSIFKSLVVLFSVLFLNLFPLFNPHLGLLMYLRFSHPVLFWRLLVLNVLCVVLLPLLSHCLDCLHLLLVFPSCAHFLLLPFCVYIELSSSQSFVLVAVNLFSCVCCYAGLSWSFVLWTASTILLKMHSEFNSSLFPCPAFGYKFCDS